MILESYSVKATRLSMIVYEFFFIITFFFFFWNSISKLIVLGHTKNVRFGSENLKFEKITFGRFQNKQFDYYVVLLKNNKWC